MSVINKVLRELDQRHAIAASSNESGPREVRPVRDPSQGHEWFWRFLAVLLVAALAWVGWVIYQVQPRRIATDLGIAAGESARRDASRAVAEKRPVAAEPSATPPVSATEPAGGLKLAQSIQTPIAETRPEPERVPAVVPEKPVVREPPKPKPPQKAASTPRVEKHELT